MVYSERIKISVIIPVYNTGKYLERCVDSVINQTFSEWELLLIDDGSTDDSRKICDRFTAIDSRIHVVHKENEGVSVARNVGLELARGEYIGFVDSDDTIVPQMYEQMYFSAKEDKAEVVMCDAVTVYSDSHEEPDTVQQLAKSCTIEKSDWTPSLLKEMAGSSWRCIYSSALIHRHSSQFPVALKFSEDRVFNIYMMGYANRLSYIKEPFYKRLMWEGSAVHRFHEDYFESAKHAAKCTEKALQEAWNNEEQYQKEYLEQFIMSSVAAINNYFYKTSPWSWKKKYQAVKNLCNDSQLCDALKKNPCGGVRGSWIKQKHCMLLCMSAMLLNRKYGR